MTKANRKTARRPKSTPARPAPKPRKPPERQWAEEFEARREAALATATKAHDTFVARLKAVDPSLLEAFKEYKEGRGALLRVIADMNAEVSEEIGALRQDHDALKAGRKTLTRGQPISGTRRGTR